MNRPIDLHDESCCVAVEVRDEACDHLLAAEVEPAEPVAADALPQYPFRRCHLASEFLRARQLDLIDTLPADDVTWANSFAVSPFPLREGGRGVRLIHCRSLFGNAG